jgi:ferredoxin-NADP reductase
VANGTGISPFAAMAADGFTSPRTLLHGIRISGHTHYREVFAGKPGLEYLPCLSTATDADGPDGLRVWPGRLTTWLWQNRQRLTAPEDRWMLCGSTGMVAEVRSILAEHGVGHERIHSETWY